MRTAKTAYRKATNGSASVCAEEGAGFCPSGSNSSALAPPPHTIPSSFVSFPVHSLLPAPLHLVSCATFAQTCSPSSIRKDLTDDCEGVVKGGEIRGVRGAEKGMVRNWDPQRNPRLSILAALSRPIHLPSHGLLICISLSRSHDEHGKCVHPLSTQHRLSDTCSQLGYLYMQSSYKIIRGSSGRYE